MTTETAGEAAVLNPQRGNASRRLVQRIVPLSGIFLFLILWQVLVTLLEVPTYLLPTPTRIGQEIVTEFPTLMEHSWVTLYEIILGFGLAIVVAVPLAVAITSSRRFDRFVTPFLLFSQTIPKIAIAPLFLIWFGFGPLPKILVAFLICFFPIVIDTAVGLRSVAPEMLDLVRSMGAGRLQIFTRIRLPSSLPYLFSGLKIAVTLAVAGAIVGEFVGADKGLGYLLLVANSNLNTPLLFASITVLTVIGIVLYYLIETLEHALIPWHITRRAEHGTM